MKLSFTKSFIAVLALTFSSSAFAADSCTGQLCKSVIKKLYVDASGVLIQPTLSPSTLSCAPVSGVYLRLEKSHANYDSIYAGLLSSRLIGESVSLRVNTDGTSCVVTYAVFGE